MVSIFFRNADGADVGEIEFDVSPSRSLSLQNEVTDYPVEGGSSGSDHIRRLPVKLVVEGMVTNSPIIVLSDSEQFTIDKAQLAFDKIDEAYRNGYLVDVVTNEKTYLDMVIEKADIPRTASTGEAMFVSLSFKEFITVNTELVTVPNVSSATTGAAAGTKEGGTDEVDKGKKTVGDSTLYDIGQSLGFIPKG